MSQVFDKWKVRVGGESYGPYTHDLMARFVAEGRVTAVTEITADEVQGWFVASRYPQFAEWQAGAAQVGTQTRTGYGAGQTAGQVAANIAGRGVTSGPITRHLVLAELRSGNAMPFLRVVQSYMQCTRISDSVWLVDGAGDTDALTHALRLTLGAGDRLFVADITGQATGQAGFQQQAQVG